MPQCRSCGAEIIWALTEKGNRIPLDADPVELLHGRFLLSYDDSPTPVAIAMNVATASYVSHFATCPNADQHRRHE